MYKSITTHAGNFHADEILAIATIFHFYGELPITRTYSPDTTDYLDPSVLVLDIGRRYEPDMSNFDHHQDGNLPSTNILILDHFCSDKDLKKDLEKHLYWYVDKVDRGHIVEETSGAKIPTFSSMIRNFNNMPLSFYQALAFARTTLATTIETIKKENENKLQWGLVEKHGHIAINHGDKMTAWREFAQEDGIMLLVEPNPRGGYSITTRDSKALPIPQHPQQTFLHANQFTASYPDFPTALDHAKEIMKNISF